MRVEVLLFYEKSLQCVNIMSRSRSNITSITKFICQDKNIGSILVLSLFFRPSDGRHIKADYYGYMMITKKATGLDFTRLFSR